MSEIAKWAAGDWPLRPDLLRIEADAYISFVRDQSLWELPTRCPPWTVLDVTRHLAATFHRYVELLRRSRTGDFRPPFKPEDLAEENLRAVREFTGDPIASACEEGARFISLADDPAEPMINQRGTISVGLQMCFGLNEFAIHHDDVAAAHGGTYRPSDEVLGVLIETWRALTHGKLAGDRWEWILRASGR
ncbi:MAG TPA: maleylpyruvate isomerase family mycothiol-dependent enzyme [Actinomycetota bacterium]|nr:maleylpyruvate isomerase family mycothiol-dependent enzyme [Actinomycetota bacterium]